MAPADRHAWPADAGAAQVGGGVPVGHTGVDLHVRVGRLYRLFAASSARRTSASGSKSSGTARPTEARGPFPGAEGLESGAGVLRLLGRPGQRVERRRRPVDACDDPAQRDPGVVVIGATPPDRMRGPVPTCARRSLPSLPRPSSGARPGVAGSEMGRCPPVPLAVFLLDDHEVVARGSARCSRPVTT